MQWNTVESEAKANHTAYAAVPEITAYSNVLSSVLWLYRLYIFYRTLYYK